MGFHELILRSRIAIGARKRKNLVRRIVTEKMRRKRILGALFVLYDALELTRANTPKLPSNEKSPSLKIFRTS